MKKKLHRGGAYTAGTKGSRSARRDYLYLDDDAPNAGFRLTVKKKK